MTAINNNRFLSHTLSLTSSMVLFSYKNSWYNATGAINHLCNACNIFTSHIKCTTPKPIKVIGRSIMSLGIGILRLNVQLMNQSIMPINLCNRYYALFSITNLVFGSSFFKKGFYFYGGKCTLNRISDDLVNRLFAL